MQSSTGLQCRKEVTENAMLFAVLHRIYEMYLLSIAMTTE